MFCPPSTMILRSFAACTLSVLASLSLGACQAQSEHDKIFFSCSAQFPTCPKKQVCNLEDNCCHPLNEAPNAPKGQCKLIPGGTGTLSGTLTSNPSSTQSQGR